MVGRGFERVRRGVSEGRIVVSLRRLGRKRSRSSVHIMLNFFQTVFQLNLIFDKEHGAASCVLTSLRCLSNKARYDRTNTMRAS